MAGASVNFHCGGVNLVGLSSYPLVLSCPVVVSVPFPALPLSCLSFSVMELPLGQTPSQCPPTLVLPFIFSPCSFFYPCIFCPFSMIGLGLADTLPVFYLCSSLPFPALPFHLLPLPASLSPSFHLPPLPTLSCPATRCYTMTTSAAGR